MSVLARAGHVESEDTESDGDQAGAGEIFAVLIQAEHENHSCDDPAITKEAGAPGGDGDHRVDSRLGAMDALTGPSLPMPLSRLGFVHRYSRGYILCPSSHLAPWWTEY